MDEWIRAVHHAREVLGEEPDRMPETAGAVRAVVYESWKRSRLQGLDPGGVAPGYYSEVDLDSYLTRAVTPLVENRQAALEQSGCALSLTDSEGRLLRRWVPDQSFAARLDSLHVGPRFSVAESHVGTTSAITLLSGQPVIIRGPEHFADAFDDLTCAGAPILHPVTRRIVGSVDLTCRLGDTSPIVLSWVMELAANIHDALRRSTSWREQLLLDSYLAHNRDNRHPLVALDQHTIITNAAAARLVGGVDQVMLWEHAAGAMRGSGATARPLALADGTTVTVETQPVTHGPSVIGAVLKLRPGTAASVHPSSRPLASGRGQEAAVLPGLVGRSARWTSLCRQAAAVDEAADRVLLVGEPGSGRLAVAAALAPAGPLRVADAADAVVRGPERWLREVETEVDGPDETLVLRDIDRLNPDMAQATERAIGRRPGRRRVYATSQAGPHAPGPRHALLDTFCEVLEVPSLRERLEDLPALLAALTARSVGDGTGVRWMPDAIQALSRLEWPGNVASLESLVRAVVGRNRAGYVGAADLPISVAARAARRPLAKLEEAEAKAIMQALRDAGGNKYRAAESLGIARSTLYRKVRALGLDLTAATF